MDSGLFQIKNQSCNAYVDLDPYSLLGFCHFQWEIILCTRFSILPPKALCPSSHTVFLKNIHFPLDKNHVVCGICQLCCSALRAHPPQCRCLHLRAPFSSPNRRTGVQTPTWFRVCFHNNSYWCWLPTTSSEAFTAYLAVPVALVSLVKSLCPWTHSLQSSHFISDLSALLLKGNL